MPDLHLSADLAEVSRMNVWFDALAAAAGTPVRLAGDMKLCLNEAVANVIDYGYDDPAAAEIDVTVEFGDEAIVAIVTDNGRPFDPLAAPAALPLTDLASAPIGGFGIKLIRETASSLAYAREGDRNRLTITCTDRP